MATATIQFVYGATTINPPTPDYPERPGVFLDQSVQIAMGGRVTSITRGSGTIVRPTLGWTDMSDADHTTLENFWFTTVGGSSNTVTYTDWVPNSAISVKYLGGLEAWEQVDYDSWEGELHLIKV